jgi:hypothetical protein
VWYKGSVRVVLVRILLGVLLAIAACRGNGAEEMLEIAKFEELQNNHQHARELYERIIAKDPNSEAARAAAERLKALPRE